MLAGVEIGFEIENRRNRTLSAGDSLRFWYFNYDVYIGNLGKIWLESHWFSGCDCVSDCFPECPVPRSIQY